jgi:hypothetical protein
MGRRCGSLDLDVESPPWPGTLVCRIAESASSAFRSTARMKLDTLEPPVTSLTSTSVARRPIRCTLFIVPSSPFAACDACPAQRAGHPKTGVPFAPAGTDVAVTCDVGSATSPQANPV